MQFVWKDAVRRSQRLSRGAKHTAAAIVDEYIYRPDSTCFASNLTLSKMIGVDKRTVQRHIHELQSKGYIRKYAEPGRRRVIALNYAVVGKHATKGDRCPDTKTTQLSSEHDRTATHYKKNRKNNYSGNRAAAFTAVTVGEEKHAQLQSWKQWVESHTEHDWGRLLERLRISSGYNFPSRHLPSTADAERTARDFFDAHMRGG
jgi:DNA-binding MarR family transcriptional regulator